jgi:hypothetical protein
LFLGTKLYLNTQNLDRKEEDKEQEQEEEQEKDPVVDASVDEYVRDEDKDATTVATDTISATASSSSSFSSSALLQINTTQTLNRRSRVQEKKYLQLPAGTGLYGTENQVDFSLDLSYQSLISKLQDGKEKLRNSLSTHGRLSGEVDEDFFTNSPVWSINSANLAMKKYLFHISDEERGIVQVLLSALETHNLNLCNNLASDPTAWQR